MNLKLLPIISILLLIVTLGFITLYQFIHISPFQQTYKMGDKSVILNCSQIWPLPIFTKSDNWLRFDNGKYAFSYPREWKLTSCRDGFVIIDKKISGQEFCDKHEKPAILISTYEYYPSLPDEYTNKPSHGIGSLSDGSDVCQLNIDNNLAYRVDVITPNPDGSTIQNGRVVILTHGKTIFDIGLNNIADYGYVYKQFLSTFKIK